MCTIPRNTSSADADRKSAIEKAIVEHLRDNATYYSYKYSNGVPLSLAEEIIRDFQAAGYWGKIVYFRDGRSAYQSFWISRDRLNETHAAMVYSDVYQPR